MWSSIYDLLRRSKIISKHIIVNCICFRWRWFNGDVKYIRTAVDNKDATVCLIHKMIMVTTMPHLPDENFLDAWKYLQKSILPRESRSIRLNSRIRLDHRQRRNQQQPYRKPTASIEPKVARLTELISASSVKRFTESRPDYQYVMSMHGRRCSHGYRTYFRKQIW